MKKSDNNIIPQGKNRETFSSGLTIFFATLGSAVGLGNIWKFPYLVGENGGGAFVLIYFISILLIGIPVMVSALFILFFYNAVGGIYSPIIWQGVVLLVVSLILIAGVKNGIELITKTLMPVLFVLLILCSIRALTLPGAKEGLNFLFKVDFSKVNSSVILSALGLAFFKFSLGMGTMVTYGSYFTDDNNLIHTSAKVALSDTLVSALAGIAIFPVVFTFGLAPDSGPGLLFNTIPLVFSKIPFGNILLIAFMSENWNIKRKHSVMIVSGIIFLVGVLTTHPTSIFGNTLIFNKSFFDLFDFISSNVATLHITKLQVLV